MLCFSQNLIIVFIHILYVYKITECVWVCFECFSFFSESVIISKSDTGFHFKKKYDVHIRSKCEWLDLKSHFNRNTHITQSISWELHLHTKIFTNVLVTQRRNSLIITPLWLFFLLIFPSIRFGFFVALNYGLLRTRKIYQDNVANLKRLIFEKSLIFSQYYKMQRNPIKPVSKLVFFIRNAIFQMCSKRRLSLHTQKCPLIDYIWKVAEISTDFIN